MKASDILALSKAGYTSAEIAVIAQGLDAEDKQPKQEQPKQEQPKQEQPKQEQPKQEQPKQEQPKQEQPNSNDAILEEIRKLNQNIYKANIQNSRMPEQQTPEDIIAEIIRPTKKEV